MIVSLYAGGMTIRDIQDPLKDTQPRRAVRILGRSDRSHQMRPREFASIDLHLAAIHI
jgi:hypothetical protein